MGQIDSNLQLSCTPKIKEKLNFLRETLNDIADHYTISTDPDARVGHKSRDHSFFGFKTHIAITDERIITGATITSGEKNDGGQFSSLVEKSKANGVEIDTIVADTGYSGADNLQLASEENISLISKLNPCITKGYRKNEDTFDYNKDAGMYICPAGHMAIKKNYHSREKEKKSPRWVYYFDVGKCKVCSKREGCYKAGARQKTYNVVIKIQIHLTQQPFEETQEFKEKYRERYKIEAKNAELKHVYGYDRAISYGLKAMNLQAAMAIFACNLKRILKLL